MFGEEQTSCATSLADASSLRRFQVRPRPTASAYHGSHYFYNDQVARRSSRRACRPHTRGEEIANCGWPGIANGKQRFEGPTPKYEWLNPLDIKTSKHFHEMSEYLVFWLCLAENNDTLPLPLYHPLNSFSPRDLKDICTRNCLSIRNLSSGAPQCRRHHVIPFHDEDNLAVESVTFLPGRRHVLIINDLGDV